MRFYGATRGEPGKAVNDDAFACLGHRAIVLDGAGNAQGAAEVCVDFLLAQHEASSDMPLNELIEIATQFFLGANQQSTLLALHVQRSSFLTAVSCGDSLLYLVREGRVEQMNETTKPRLGTLQPGIKYWHFPSGHQTSLSERVMAYPWVATNCSALWNGPCCIQRACPRRSCRHSAVLLMT